MLGETMLYTGGQDRELVVLYGSQTGTAEEVAESVIRDGIRRHFKTKLSSLDDYDMVGIIRWCLKLSCECMFFRLVYMYISFS